MYHELSEAWNDKDFRKFVTEVALMFAKEWWGW